MASLHSTDSSNAGRSIYPYAGMRHHYPYPDDAQPGAPHERSAYRIFAPDPVIYTDSIDFLWRNGDTMKKGAGGTLPSSNTCLGAVAAVFVLGVLVCFVLVLVVLCRDSLVVGWHV